MKSLLRKLQPGIKVTQGETSKNMIYESQRTFPAKVTAQQAFGQAVYRLFHVDAWSRVSTLVADFDRCDAESQSRPDGSPVVGEHILVRRPGPLPANGVQVVDRNTDEHWIADPRQGDTQPIEPFFDRQVSSTFRVVRHGHTLTAADTGRQETINQTEPQAGAYAVANRLTAGTSWLFDQQMPWKLLTDYPVAC